MRDVEPFVFRSFREDVPDFLRTWRRAEEAARWDRHYLVRPGYTLAVTCGTAVELSRARLADGLRIDQTVLCAAFPLDWMSLSLIAGALPKAFAGVELDGRSAQGFVDSLAFRELPQASVLKEYFRAECGAVTATATTVRVPDWNARAVSIAFESFSASALRNLLSAAGLRGQPHRDLDDWLRSAHAVAAAASEVRAA